MFNITTVVFDGPSPPFIEGGGSVILDFSSHDEFFSDEKTSKFVTRDFYLP